MEDEVAQPEELVSSYVDVVLGLAFGRYDYGPDETDDVEWADRLREARSIREDLKQYGFRIVPMAQFFAVCKLLERSGDLTLEGREMLAQVVEADG